MSVGLSEAGITYSSEAQWPRSSTRHRSLQNGIFGSLNGTFLPQMGHRTLAAMLYYRIAAAVGFEMLAPRIGKGFEIACAET